MTDIEDNQESIPIGVYAYIAMDKAKEERWNNRPTCCGSKVNAFDEGSFICGGCNTIHEGSVYKELSL